MLPKPPFKVLPKPLPTKIATNKHPPPQQSVTEQPVQQVAPAQPIAQQPIEPIPSQPIEPQVQALPPKPAPQITEQVVRRRAYALTRYGGKVLVRSHPSRNGRKLGFLYDREDVYVVAITNHCETIDRLQGCWVKVVDANGLTGYSFGGYLQY